MSEASPLQFRRKPVVVEAFQLTRERRADNSEWPDWLNIAWQGGPGVGAWASEYPNSDGTDHIALQTSHGVQIVEWDDWIIHSGGELYACRPSRFAELYEDAATLSAEDELEVLRRWKAEMLAVDATWNDQHVAELMALKVGDNIRPKIAPYIQNLQATLAARAKTMLRLRDNFVMIRDEIEDEQDRVYFGSTNHAELFKELVDDLDGWAWDDIINDGQLPDYIGDNRRLRDDLRAIAEFVPPEDPDKEPYQQIATHSKQRARQALSEPAPKGQS